MGTENLQTEELVVSYLHGGSASSLARQHGVSVWSVLARLRAVGVPIRSNQNERRVGVPLTREYTFQELVDGVMLGDGSIDKKGVLHLDQCLVHAGWLDDLMEKFRLVGGEARVIPTPARERVLGGRLLHGGEGHHLYTPAYRELQKQRIRWYPEGVKRVPQDIRFTPMVVAQWLCGDGTGPKNGTLNFCTNGFSESCVDLLVVRFREDLQIHTSKQATPRRGQFTLGVLSRGEALRVGQMVGVFVPPCFRYKLKYLHPAVHPKLLPDQVAEIRRRAAAGEDPKILAATFGKSPQAVRALLRGASFRGLSC